MAKKLQEIVRGSGKKVVFTFGRFNPPTTGHEKLIDTVVSLARRNGAENRIYISNSQDARKNPLPPRDKKRFMSKAFPKANIILSPEAITPFHAFDILREEGFSEITMVVGSDRVTEFRNSIQKYMNKEGIKLDKFEVVSAGERDPDAEGVAGMSGSKLRELAQQGKMDTFMTGLPSNLQDADKKQIYDILRKEMGISESLDITEQKEDEDESITVLVLTSSAGDFKGTIGRLKKSCEKRNITFNVIRSKTAYIDTTQVRKNKLKVENYNGKGDNLTINPRRTVCFVRGGSMKTEVGMALIRIMENYGVFTINEFKTMQFCSNKLATMIELERQKVSIPRTAYVPSGGDVELAHKKIGGQYPVVIKTITGAEGIGVSIVDSYASLKSVLQSLWKYNAEVIIQEYFEIKYDVRTLVLDGKIFACAKRIKGGKDFRTNIALGNKGGPHELSDVEKEIVLKAAKISGGFYVGVYHIIHEGKPYVLELNGSPGSANMYFNYYNNEGKQSKVDGEQMIDNLIDYIADRDRWEIAGVEAGVIENIEIWGKKLEAKLDTGNFGHNSMHAKDIKIIGEFPSRKVSFIDYFGKKHIMPLKSVAKVKSNPTTTEKRPTIETDIRFRGLEFKKVRFNLIDRNNNNYPVLLGSRFLEQAKISVNPSKIHQLPEENDSMKLKALLEREQRLLESGRKEEARLLREEIETEKKKVYEKYSSVETTLDEDFEHYIHEVSPPSGPAKRFSKKTKVKKQFQQKYGADDWKKVFYGTAWKMYNRGKNEEFTPELTEELGTIYVDSNRFPNPLPSALSSVFLVKGEIDGDKRDDIVPARNMSYAAKSLLPSQSEIFMGKSLGMAIGGVKGGDLGAVVSSDNHILDGHHRWAATMFSDPNAKVKGVGVSLTIGDLVPVLRAVGDALGNVRRGMPGGGDINIYQATFKDVLDAVQTGKNMDPRFYNKEKALAWLESIGGEAELKKRFQVIQRTTPPAGAPPRTDMPVIDADKGQVKLVSDLLKNGKLDIKKPYAKTSDIAKRPEFAAKAAAMRRAGVAESVEDEREETYKKWNELVNMSAKELADFIDSEEGEEAGLSRKESGKAGAGGKKITSGRDSARAIVRMLKRDKEEWSDNDWKWANKQINFISRMSGNEGPNRDEKGRPTRKLLSLKIWGHDPEK